MSPIPLFLPISRPAAGLSLLRFLLVIICLPICLLLAEAESVLAQDSNVEIRIEGIERAVHDNVVAALSLNRQSQQTLGESRLRFLHGRAPDEIQQAMKVFGYYNPTIDASLETTESGWLAVYKITPGKPVIIEKIDIKITGPGADTEPFQELRQSQPFVKGQRLEHQTYTNYKNRLARRARELGYFEAGFKESELRVNPAKHRAAVIMKFTTGPRYRYGPVSFNDTLFSETYLRNYIPFGEGDPYNSQGPLQLREVLVNTDMFNSVEVRPDETRGEAETVPVSVQLEPRKPHRYTAGIGFATDTGPRLSLGWNARYLNERGHQFNSNLRVSPVTSNLTGTYLMPYFRNRPADIGLSGSLKNEDTDTAQTRSGEATLFQSRSRWGWNETLSTTYLVEDFEVADDRETSKLLIPSASWWKTWSDDPLYAKRGGRLRFEIKGAAEPLLSDTSFVQARIAGKYVRALGFRNRLLARLEFGATEVSDFEQLPASLRFFAGGDNSIRGYDYQSLGPKNDDGQVTGGRYLIVGSIEYEQFVYKNYGVAAFVDFGNAVNDFSDPLEVGTGAGLRWLSPVGLIKLDVGVGITEPDTPIRLHISLGADL